MIIFPRIDRLYEQYFIFSINIVSELNKINAVLMIFLFISGSPEQHIASLRQVSERFRNARIQLRGDKSRLGFHEVEFLGSIITPMGHRPLPNTVAWDSAALEAFSTLKQFLTKSPLLLVYPDWNEPFYVQADASKVAVGGILSQRDSGGSLKPIAFFLRG